MSFLIFCSYEVGGLPFAYAQALNRQCQTTYYVSLAKSVSGHDSSSFHFGPNSAPWDLSANFSNQDGEDAVASKLADLCDKYAVTYVFATGDKAYLLERAKIPYSYWSYGSDLDQLCFPRLPSWRGSLNQWKFFVYCLLYKGAARCSICLSEQVMIAPYQLNSLDQVCENKRLFFLPHLIQAEDFETVLTAKKAAQQELQARYHTDNIFFSSVRHYWQGTRSAWSDNKGNDKVIRAFALYLNQCNPNNARLLLVDKGPDVLESKRLAVSLGIDRWITWLPEMKRSKLQSYLSGATACLGQFGTPVLTYAQLEPLAWATPCISFYGKTDSSIPFYKNLPPIINVNTVEDICAAMSSISTSGEVASELSKHGWEWVNENCSEEVFAASFAEQISGL